MCTFVHSYLVLLVETKITQKAEFQARNSAYFFTLFFIFKKVQRTSIEIYCMADDFCKDFDAQMKKYTIQAQNKRKYHRDSTLSKSEVMVIMILFHSSGYRCLKHFYLQHVCKQLRHLFPKKPSIAVERFIDRQLTLF